MIASIDCAEGLLFIVIRSQAVVIVGLIKRTHLVGI